MKTKRNLVALLAGALFAAGLAISGMTQPSKVIGFLDATGAWDPSLAFVMMGAVGLNLLVFRRVLQRKSPVLDGTFHLPRRKEIDARLIGGALLFGLGWGIVGYCPGPAIVSLITGHTGPILFVAAMIGGFAAQHLAESVLRAVGKAQPDVSG
jgi:hypothetical protein